MSEEKMYAVKNDDGEWSDDSGAFYPEKKNGTGFIFTMFSDRDEATGWAERNTNGGHVVTLVEEPKPLVVPEWFDKWLDAFCRQGDGYSWRDLAAGRILQQGWGKSINDSYEATESHWAIPHVENKQVDYVLHHKKELIVAALTGNYTVAKEKKYNVKVPQEWCGDDKHYWTKEQDGALTWAWLINKDYMIPTQQFTLTEIEHYGLQYCKKEEVADDEQ